MGSYRNQTNVLGCRSSKQWSHQYCLVRGTVPQARHPMSGTHRLATLVSMAREEKGAAMDREAVATVRVVAGMAAAAAATAREEVVTAAAAAVTAAAAPAAAPAVEAMAAPMAARSSRSPSRAGDSRTRRPMVTRHQTGRAPGTVRTPPRRPTASPSPTGRMPARRRVPVPRTMMRQRSRRRSTVQAPPSRPTPSPCDHPPASVSSAGCAAARR